VSHTHRAANTCTPASRLVKACTAHTSSHPLPLIHRPLICFVSLNPILPHTDTAHNAAHPPPPRHPLHEVGHSRRLACILLRLQVQIGPRPFPLQVALPRRSCCPSCLHRIPPPSAPTSKMNTSREGAAIRRASGELLVRASLISGEEEGKEDGSTMNIDAVAAALEAVVPLSPTGRRTSSTSTSTNTSSRTSSTSTNTSSRIGSTSTSTSTSSTSTSSISGIPTSELGAASFPLTTETTTTTAVPSSSASATHTPTITTTTTSTPSMSSSSTPPPPILNPRRLSGAGSHENFSPQVIQRLAREVRELMTSPPEGITFVPNDEETLMEIHVDMQGPVGTPYEEGAFRLKLVLSRNYPHSPPRAFFLTKIYHPNVAWSGGDVCVDVLKRTWSADITLGHTFQVIQCLLIVPFPESSLNDEAGRLFMQGYEEVRGKGGGHGLDNRCISFLVCVFTIIRFLSSHTFIFHPFFHYFPTSTVCAACQTLHHRACQGPARRCPCLPQA